MFCVMESVPLTHIAYRPQSYNYFMRILSLCPIFPHLFIPASQLKMCQDTITLLKKMARRTTENIDRQRVKRGAFFLRVISEGDRGEEQTAWAASEGKRSKWLESFELSRKIEGRGGRMPGNLRESGKKPTRKWEETGGKVGKKRQESRKKLAGNELTTGVVRTYHLSGKNLRLKW